MRDAPGVLSVLVTILVTVRELRCSDSIVFRRERGFHHRVGHLLALSMTLQALNASFLRCFGVAASPLGNWGGRRHDQGPYSGMVLPHRYCWRIV